MSETEEERAEGGALSKAERDKLERMGEAFDKIDRLLYRFGLQGLQRVTEASLTELQALQQTAHNGALVNIERQLQLLETWVQRYIERDPLFQMHAYANALNRIWLLNQQARKLHAQGKTPDQMADVIGELRRSYTERDEPITLQPLGASGWCSDTDFVGITVYFYADVEGAPILQASNSKPTAYFGTDPRRLLHDAISEHVHFSIWDMAHGAFEFRRAKMSSDGRLSLHKDLIVKQAPYIGGRAYEKLSCDDWISLAERIKTQERNPIEGTGSSYILIVPAEVGPVITDEKAAKATIQATDKRGGTLLMEVNLRPENNFLIDNLEYVLGTEKLARQTLKEGEEAETEGAAGPQKRRRRLLVGGGGAGAGAGKGHPSLLPNAWFGKAWVSEGKVRFFPYTAVYHQAVVYNSHGKKRVNEIHLSLEDLKYVSTKD